MSLFHWLFRRIRTLLNPALVDDDVRRELELHIALEVEHRCQRGLALDEARRTTLRDFGAPAAVREAVRDVRGITVVDAVSQDVRVAIRTLRRWPGYTLATVLTLALGIGANTAIFSLVNEVLLRPLPYADADRLVRITQARTAIAPGEVGIGIDELDDYRASLQSVERLVEYHGMSFVLLEHGEPDRVNTGVVSTDFFDMFGIRVLHGRGFVDSDDEHGADPVLLLSHEYWQRKFGGQTSVVGQVVQMNDRPHRIVGILPPIPPYPREHDVYMPISACPFRAEAVGTERRRFAALGVFGRLKPGASLEDASREVVETAGQFSAAHASVYLPAATGFKARLLRLNDEMVGDARSVLLALLGTTLLVLLIACANVANMSLSRMVQRNREMAMRLALGAGRGRLLRQLLTESLIVSGVGGALGLVFAWLSIGALTAFAGRFTTRALDPGIDATVLLFTAAVAIATGLLFGILPALSARPAVMPALKDGGPQAGDGPRPRRIRSVLVVAQVSVCFALLIGAGLFLDTLRRLSAVDLGFRSDRVLTAEVFSNWSRQTTPDDLRQLYSVMLDRIRNVKGVVSAAVTNGVPLANTEPGERPVILEGAPDADLALLPLADQRVSSEGYFETLGIPLLRGRDLLREDDQHATDVAVINESMARLWNGEDPIGRRFQPYADDRWYTVVGIVPDVRQFAMDRAAGAQFYTPFRQSPGFGGRVLLRTEGDPMDYVDALKAAVYAADPEVPVESIETLESLRALQLQPPGLNAALLGTFAALALMITAGGIAAVVGSYVSQRTREFGVRMALGATRQSLVRMVLRQGMGLVGIGLLLGTAASLILGRAVTAFLYETRATDPVIYGVMGAVFVVTALAACLGPVRRATSIDPLLALRAD